MTDKESELNALSAELLLRCNAILKQLDVKYENIHITELKSKIEFCKEHDLKAIYDDWPTSMKVLYRLQHD